MIANAAIATDLVLSLTALAGLICLHFVLHGRGDGDPITRRFVFALRVAMLLFAGRAMVVTTGGAGFRFAVLLAASLVPLAALLLAEGLLRRHAPRFIKIIIAGGACIFGITAFWYGAGIDPARLVGLLAFQVASFAMIGWLIATRDRSTLTSVENQSAGRLGWTLVVLVPLIMTDFLLIYLRLPVQLSAIGVLLMCWIALDLGRGVVRHRHSFAQLATIVAVGLATGAGIATLGQMGRDGIILSAVLVTAAMLLLAIMGKAYATRRHAVRLVDYIATAPMDSPVAFLRGLQAHPLVQGAAVIEGAALNGFDTAVLGEIFRSHPILRKSAPPDMRPVAADHINHLFTRFGATHILDTGQTPPQLIALVMPAFQGSDNAENELMAVQRIAALIARTTAQETLT